MAHSETTHDCKGEKCSVDHVGMSKKAMAKKMPSHVFPKKFRRQSAQDRLDEEVKKMKHG